MDLLEVFQDSTDLLDFSAGEEILSEGNEGDRMFVVMRGEVAVSVKGRELARAGPGEIVGEMAVIDTSMRSATVTAVQDCQLVPIDKSSFEAMVRHVPDFMRHVMNVLAGRLQAAYELLEK